MGNNQLNNNQSTSSSSLTWWQNWMRKIIRGILGILFSGELFINVFASLLTVPLKGIFGPDTILGALFIFRQQILLGMACILLIVTVLLWQPVMSDPQFQRVVTQNRRRWWPQNEGWRLLFITCLVLVIGILVNMLWISPENVSVSFTPITKKVPIQDFPIDASSEFSEGKPLTIPIKSYSFSQSYTSSSATATNENCSDIIFGVKINCHTSVSKGDVYTAFEVMRFNLEYNMIKKLYQQSDKIFVSGVNFTQIDTSSIKSSVKVGDVIESPDKKFIVTITQMQYISVQYIDNSDIKNVVLKYLDETANAHKEGCPGGYKFLSDTLQMNPPNIPRADLDQPVVNELTLQITANATYSCQFGQNQLETIQNSLVGKSHDDAQKYLGTLSGIDQNSDISIDILTGIGSNLPVDPAHIHIHVNSPPQIYSSPISPGS